MFMKGITTAIIILFCATHSWSQSGIRKHVDLCSKDLLIQNLKQLEYFGIKSVNKEGLEGIVAKHSQIAYTPDLQKPAQRYP